MHTTHCCKHKYLPPPLSSGIAADTFANLVELSVLRLDNNLLSTFPVWQLASNPLLTGLSLANNLWSCQCEFLNHLAVFQKRLGAVITDREDIRCVTDHFLGEAVTPLENVICADQPQANSDFQSVTSVTSQMDYTPILVSVLVAVVLIVICEYFNLNLNDQES